MPQIIGKLIQTLPGQLRIGITEGADGADRIEQEMRLDLRQQNVDFQRGVLLGVPIELLLAVRDDHQEQAEQGDQARQHAEADARYQDLQQNADGRDREKGPKRQVFSPTEAFPIKKQDANVKQDAGGSRNVTEQIPGSALVDVPGLNGVEQARKLGKRQQKYVKNQNSQKHVPQRAAVQFCNDQQIPGGNVDKQKGAQELQIAGSKQQRTNRMTRNAAQHLPAGRGGAEENQIRRGQNKKAVQMPVHPRAAQHVKQAEDGKQQSSQIHRVIEGNHKAVHSNRPPGSRSEVLPARSCLQE